MKKLLALLMVLCLALTFFAGCGSEDAKEDTSKASEGKVDTAADVKAIEKCIIETNEAYLEESLNAEALLPTLGIPEEQQGTLKPAVDDFCKSIIDQVDMRVENVKVDGEKATADLVVTMPNMDDMGDLFSDPSKLFTEEEMAELTAKADAAASEEEFMLEFLPLAFNKVADKLTLTEETETVSLKKVDGKWEIEE